MFTGSKIKTLPIPTPVSVKELKDNIEKQRQSIEVELNRLFKLTRPRIIDTWFLYNSKNDYKPFECVTLENEYEKNPTPDLGLLMEDIKKHNEFLKTNASRLIPADSAKQTIRDEARPESDEARQFARFIAPFLRHQ